MRENLQFFIYLDDDTIQPLLGYISYMNNGKIKIFFSSRKKGTVSQVNTCFKDLKKTANISDEKITFGDPSISCFNAARSSSTASPSSSANCQKNVYLIKKCFHKHKNHLAYYLSCKIICTELIQCICFGL